MCRRYHNVNVLDSVSPSESEGVVHASIENVSRSPDHLTSRFSKSFARAEAALKSRDVSKVRNLALEQLHPDVITSLRNNGAFELPARETCDELVDAFFQWASPLVPILDSGNFLRSYQDPENQPSLLLTQAVLAAGSTVVGGSNLTANPKMPVHIPATYFDRARMLYEANYETDSVTLVQSLTLMGWYWEALDGVIHLCSSFTETKFLIFASQKLPRTRSTGLRLR